MKRRAGIAFFAMGQWHHNFSDPEEEKHRILYLGVMPELTIWMLDARGLNSPRVNVSQMLPHCSPVLHLLACARGDVSSEAYES